MAYTIEINGVDKTSLMNKDSLKVVPSADGRKTMSCVLKTNAATFMPSFGQDVKVKKDAAVIFGGVIKVMPLSRPGIGTSSSATIFIEISSDGYNSIPYRRTFNESIDQQSAGAIVTWLLGWLAADGITAGTIDTGINPMGDSGEYDAIVKTGGQILDECADASGYKWFIDDNKALQFYAEDAVANAEHDIVIGGAFTDFRNVKVTPTMDGYANKVFLRGAIDDLTGVPIVSVVEDTTEITARQTAEGGATYSSGVYGITIDRPNISTQADADVAATKELQKRCREPIQIEFDSNTVDWTVGKKLKVNLPTFGISDDTYFLVEEANLDEQSGVPFMHISGTRRNEASFSTQRSQSVTDYWSKVVNNNNSTTSGTSSSLMAGYALDYSATNAALVTVNNTEDLIVTKTITLDSKADIKVFFSCQGEADGALTITFKTYKDAVARTYQPAHGIAGAYKNVITYIDTIQGVSAGSVTIEVKATTSANNFAIAAGFATLNLLLVPSVIVVTIPTYMAFVFGGVDTDGNKLSDNDRLNRAMDVWYSMTSLPAPARFAAGASTIGNYGYMYCGSEAARLKDCDAYWMSGNSWSAKTDADDPARNYCNALTINAKAYIAGGSDGSALTDCDEYNPSTNAWTGKTNMAANKYGYGAATVGLYGYFYNKSDTYQYDQAGNTWATKTVMVSPDRNYPSGSSIENYCYSYGGTGTPGDAYLQDCDRYDTTLDVWANMTDMPTPARRLTAAVTLSSVYAYVFGGNNGANYYLDSDQYDSSANAWTSMGDMPAPARAYHSAVAI
jgi:hypothetical protein